MEINNQQEKLEKTAQEVLEMLDRWDSKMQGHQTPKREFERKPYRAKMLVLEKQADNIFGDLANQTGHLVWARNISQGGFSFIYTSQFKQGMYLVCLESEKAGKLWFLVDIQRARLVHDEFWEHGAVIKKRVTEEQTKQWAYHPEEEGEQSGEGEGKNVDE